MRVSELQRLHDYHYWATHSPIHPFTDPTTRPPRAS